MTSDVQTTLHMNVRNQSSEPVRIAYLIDFFGGGGGTENQLAVLINNLDRTRFTPFLYTMRTVPLDNKLTVNCPVQQLNVTSLASLGAIKGINQLKQELQKNRIDILQIYFIDSNILGVIAGKLAGVSRIVISRRDMGWWYSQPRRHVTNLLNYSADYCIANAQAIKDVVSKYETIPKDKIEVIYNGVTPAKLNPATAATREMLGIPESVPIVGIVANLKAIKRIDRFVRMASQIKNTSAHFLIVGYGSEEQELTDLANSLGIGERVHFHYTADHVYDIMKLFSVGVLTSESEGLSNVLVEYALSGLPAVAFDTGGNKEAIEQGKTGFLIPAYDEKAMAQQIDALLADLPTAQRIGETARQRAEERFSITRMVQNTQAFYLRILKNNRAS